MRAVEPVAKFAISFPRVVGDAGWPWVRESIGSAAWRLASARSAAASSPRRGSITCPRDSAIISA